MNYTIIIKIFFLCKKYIFIPVEELLIQKFILSSEDLINFLEKYSLKIYIY